MKNEAKQRILATVRQYTCCTSLFCAAARMANAQNEKREPFMCCGDSYD